MSYDSRRDKAVGLGLHKQCEREYEDEEMCSAMNPTKAQRNKLPCMKAKGHSGKHQSINSNGRTIRWDR